MTGTGVAFVTEHSGVWKEDGTDPAVVIQFTNEARQVGRNADVFVKASLVYKNDHVEVLRIIGNWLYTNNAVTEFQVDDSHKLLIGILYGELFYTIGRRRLTEQDYLTIKAQPYDLPVFQTVSVRLTDANRKDILYEGEFRVTRDPLQIVPYYIGRGDVTL